MQTMIRALLIASIAIALLLAGIGAYGYASLSAKLDESGQALIQAREDAQAQSSAHELALAERQEENILLAGELRREQQKNGTFSTQLQELTGTVGALEKLAKTDPELLAKYSKVYFLNENYIPSKLDVVASEFAFQEGRTYEIHGDVEPFLEDLLKDAEGDGLKLLVASSYRSFDTQAALKSGYQVRYGSGANAFSADQGYSEHQLGTAVDFTTSNVGGTFAGFDKTEEYTWLMDNAWSYGFILSYPKGNAYYQYEPWHWRFVGRELAERLHEDDAWFYDLDQRAIDEYLGGLFD